jgi:UDP-N-acetylmuramyl pentapeptide phosphotransferase/UDP-N-acetylglucosamine-1-phosphate transferase
MLDVLLTASVSFIISFLAIPVVLQIAEQKKLYDVPDERKIHTHAVTSLGGVAIFSGFLLAALLSIQGYLNPNSNISLPPRSLYFSSDSKMILSSCRPARSLWAR